MEQFHQDVLDIVRKTRKLSLPGFGSAAVTHHKGVELTDLVTEVDHAVENTLKQELAKLDPSISFVGEEFGGNREAKKYWISDPLDGTGLYVRGLPHCTTMLALVDRDQVQFGVIYDFVQDILYYAVRGHGAFANEEKLSVSDRTFADSQVYIGYEVRSDNPQNEDFRNALLSKCIGVKYMCAGHEYVLVAQGKLEGRICTDPYGYDYDFAAGTLLVEEAGGVAVGLDGRPYRPSIRPHIVANPHFYTDLTQGPDALFPVTE